MMKPRKIGPSVVSNPGGPEQIGQSVAAVDSPLDLPQDKPAARSAWRSIALPRVSIYTVILGCILCCALALRLAGIASGLPLVLFGDEVTVVEHAAGLRWGDLSPHVYMYGQLPFYLFRVGMLLGSPLQALVTGHSQTLPDLYLLSRLISTAFGTATVYLAYVLGNLVADRRVGLFSAGLFALSPLAIELSHYATVDSMMGFWAILTLTGVAMALKGQRNGLYMAGVAAGLAASTKYNAVVLLVPVLLAAIELQLQWQQGDENKQVGKLQRNSVLGLLLLGWVVFVGVVVWRAQILGLAAKWTGSGELKSDYVAIFDKLLAIDFFALVGGAVLGMGILVRQRWADRVVRLCTGKLTLYPLLLAGAAFVVTSPFTFLDFPNFVSEFFFQLRKNQVGGLASVSTGSTTYQALVGQNVGLQPLQYVQAIGNEWGLLVSAMLLLGLWALWQRDRRAWIAFIPLVAGMIALTATWTYLATRYLYPIWPLIVLLGAMGIADCGLRIVDWFAFRVSRFAFRFAEWGLAKPRQIGAYGAIAVLFFAAPVALSLGEVRANFLLPDTRNEALAWIEKNVPAGTYIVREGDTPEVDRTDSMYRVRLSVYPFEEATLAQWKAQGVDIMMITDERVNFYKEHAASSAGVLAEYDKLEKGEHLLSKFEPGPDIKGPPIYIYELH